MKKIFRFKLYLENPPVDGLTRVMAGTLELTGDDQMTIDGPEVQAELKRIQEAQAAAGMLMTFETES